jgi:Tfp pilus assembly protein PilN
MNRAAAASRGALKPKDLDATAADAREVNDIIAGRAFSWTDLFNQLEKTLPDDVRILSITPRVERDGRMLIAMVVVARQAEDVDAFVSRLQATKTFARLLSHQETVNQEGMLETVLEGQYLRSPGRSVAKGQP